MDLRIFKHLNPPTKMKVFAPNGETKETVCWLGIRGDTQFRGSMELLLQFEDGTTEVLNKKVVVQNLETGEVVYNPRLIPVHPGAFITGSEARWLQENPTWPNILELYDNPVDGEGETDGLYA